MLQKLKVVGKCANCGEDLVMAPDGMIVHSDEDEDPDLWDHGWAKCLDGDTLAELEGEK